MTRTVTLADLAARPSPATKGTSETAASSNDESGPSFAHMLEGVGAPGQRSDQSAGNEEHRDARDRHDPLPVGSPPPPATAVELTAGLAARTGPARLAVTGIASASGPGPKRTASSASVPVRTDPPGAPAARLPFETGGGDAELSRPLEPGPTASAKGDSTPAGGDSQPPAPLCEVRVQPERTDQLPGVPSPGEVSEPASTAGSPERAPSLEAGSRDGRRGAAIGPDASREGAGNAERELGPSGAEAGPPRPLTAETGVTAPVPAVPAEPVPVASVTTTFGQFAAHLDSSPESQVSAQSGFVASNSALTAALSKPVNEGSGVYSVTAMLNPPSLGRVQAVVRVDGGDVSVSIVAHSPEGHLAIAGHIDELRQALATSGGDVQLSLADGGGKGTQHQGAEGTSAGSGDDDEVTDTIVLTASPAPSPGRSLHIIL